MGKEKPENRNKFNKNRRIHFACLFLFVFLNEGSNIRINLLNIKTVCPEKKYAFEFVFFYNDKQYKRHTNPQTEIPTTKPNRPRGQFSENVSLNIRKLKSFNKVVYFFLEFLRNT